LEIEAVVALGAEMMMLDIAGLVGAVRHLGERQIGNFRKHFVERVGGFLRGRFEPWNVLLEARHLSEELLRGLLLVALFRRADLARGGVAARQRGLRLLDRGAAALVELAQPLRLTLETAARERTVESLGILADPFDVVHDTVPKICVMPALV